jgi:GT2 family glycosyltransferase
MKVQAIIVTYNGLGWIDRCLGSLQDPDTHVLVIDNGSTDGTWEAVRDRFPKVELVRNERNLGFGQANNIGLRVALEHHAEHILLLNQDAWLQPSALNELVRNSVLHPQFGVLSPIHLNGPGDALDLQFSKYIAPDKCPGLYSDITLDRVKDGPYPVEFVNAAAWLITRHCLMTVGGFSPSFFHYGEDDNYLARLRYHNLQVGVLPNARVHHDRAQRGQSPFFGNETDLSVRRTVIHYADPGVDARPDAERRALRRKMVQCLLSGQRAAFLAARERLAVLKAASLETVVRHRAASRATGPTFL